MNDHQITMRQESELQRRGGPRGRRIHDQRSSDRVTQRPLSIVSKELQLLRCCLLRLSQKQQIFLAQPLIEKKRTKDFRVAIEKKNVDQSGAAALCRGNPFAEGQRLDVDEKLRLDGASYLRVNTDVDG